MKLSEAFNEYQRSEIQCRGCSLKTLEGMKYAERVAVGFFGDINVRKITIHDINDFYLDLTTNNCRRTGRQRPVSVNTARDYIIKLRSVIKHCQNEGVRVCDYNKIAIPKREKKSAKYLELEQYERFMATAAKPKKGYAEINRVRNVLIIKMLFYTGLRVSELCALNRDTIVNRQFTVVGKSKFPRPCFITKEIEQDIQDYLAMRADNEPALFIANETKKRITPGNIQRMFRRLNKQAGMTKVTPHTMRHSFATNMIEDKVDIRFVAALLGHQDLNTTKQYTHVKYYKLREIYVNALEKG